jgi:hypothetical protein
LQIEYAAMLKHVIFRGVSLSSVGWLDWKGIHGFSLQIMVWVEGVSYALSLQIYVTQNKDWLLP